MYRLPAESYVLLHRLLVSILFSSRNLISLAIQDTNISLDESLVNGINNHPTLDRVILNSLCQLCWLPIDFYPRTSFARIHAQGIKLDRHQLLVPDDTLHALCHRPPESSESFPGPHVYELQVETFPSSAWTGLTFNSLRKLTVRDADDTFATGGCGGFFDRHKGLEEIYLNGHGLRHESALKSVPCLRELYQKAVKRGKGMEKGFYVASVSLSRGGDSRSSTFTKLLGIDNGGYVNAPGWILKTISFTIVKDTARVLSFLLENLPPCEDLYFRRGSDDAGLVDESTNITQVGLLFS